MDHSLWEDTRSLYTSHGISDRAFSTLVYWAAGLIFYYIHGLLFVYVDAHGSMESYAVRPGGQRLPSTELRRAAVVEATLDNIVIKPILFFATHSLLKVDFGPSPSFSQGLLQWVALEVLFSFAFYVSHSTLHRLKFLYQKVHKVHHIFFKSVAFTAQYFHPVESTIGAVEFLLVVYAVRPHFVVSAVFLSTRYIEIVDAHCGYEVPWRALYPWSSIYPWGTGVRLHDYHHSHNSGCYGGGLISFDKVFGTDVEFLAYERKRILRSTTK